MAGIILTCEFEEPKNKKYENYLDYIARDGEYKAKNNSEIGEFNRYERYLDYTSREVVDGKIKNGIDEDSRAGLIKYFNETKDFLTRKDKEDLKKKFKEAQKKQACLLKPLFSFETEWLERHGIYDQKEDFLNDKKLMEYTRVSVLELLEKENMQKETVIWSAAIHKDTKHFHVHISIADLAPVWEIGKGRCKRLKDGSVVQGGALSKKSIDAMKSKFANKVIRESHINVEISNIIRNNIRLGIKNMELATNKEFKSDFDNLIAILPEDKKMWKYGLNKLKPIRPEIDNFVNKIIATNFKEDYLALRGLISSRNKDYVEAYGEYNGEYKVETENYEQKALSDMYSRLGNVILNKAKQLEKSKEANEFYEKIGNDVLGVIETYDKNKVKNKKKYRASIKEKIATNRKDLNTALYTLKKVTRKNLDSMKNQAIYEKLKNENQER